MSYRQLLANLEALPERERQLAGGRYHFRTWYGVRVCGCVLGKGVPGLGQMKRESQTKRITAYQFIAVDLIGMTGKEAREAQEANDDFGVPPGATRRDFANDKASRHARYTYMIEWLRVRVAEEVTSAASAAQAAPKAVRPLRAGGKEEA